MLSHRFFSLSLFFMFLCFSWQADAQERKSMEEQHGDVVALAERPTPPRWDASLEASFLPAAALRGGSGEVSMEEVRAGIGRRFTMNSRFDLTAGFRYALQDIDAPAAARLPDALHALSVSFGGEYRTSDRLTLGMRVSPGVVSDLKALTARDVRVPVSFTARYKSSPSLTLLGGIIVSAGSRAYPVLPILGVFYLPTDRWAFAVGFPRTGVLYRPGRGVECYLGVESGRGEYRVHDPAIGADIVSYRDFRGVGGVNIPIASKVSLGVAGGYSFARRFVFYEGERGDVSLDSVPFAKVEVRSAW